MACFTQNWVLAICPTPLCRSLSICTRTSVKFERHLLVRNENKSTLTDSFTSDSPTMIQYLGIIDVLHHTRQHVRWEETRHVTYGYVLNDVTCCTKVCVDKWQKTYTRRAWRLVACLARPWHDSHVALTAHIAPSSVANASTKAIYFKSKDWQYTSIFYGTKEVF